MALLWKLPLMLLSAVLFLIAAVVVAFWLGFIERPTIAIGDSSWGNVSRERTEIQTAVEVTNPNEFGVTLDNVALGVVVDLNDIRVARGLTDRLPVPPGESTTNIVTVIDNSTVPEWWASHVQNGEQTEAVIKPVVSETWFGRRWVVDTLEHTRDFNTNVLAPASSNRPESFSVGPYSLTVQSRTFEWGDISDETATIDGEIVLHQDSPITIRAENVAFSFAMNGVPVAQGGTQGPIQLPSGLDTPIELTAELSNQQLLEWWPTHVQAGERTRYEVQVTVAVDTPAGTATATVLDVEDSFTTELLQAFQQEIAN